MPVKLVQVGVQQLDELTPLFDAYRVFYGKPSDLDAARQYLTARLSQVEAVVFAAYLEGQAAGFSLLYPSFSSVSLARTWVLNDLFVTPSMRSRGVGEALLNEAAAFAQLSGAVRLDLRTERSNETAQRLYERLGWLRDEQFYSYSLPL